MPIRFPCKCGKTFSIASKFTGKRVKCPSCGIVLVVPLPQSGAEGAPPPRRPERTPKPKRAKGGVAPPRPAQGAPGQPTSSELELEIEPPSPKPQPSVPIPTAAGPDQITGAPQPRPPSDEIDLEVEAAPVKEPAEAAKRKQRPAERARKRTPETPARPSGGPATAERPCPKCGVPTLPDSVICVECGASLQPAEDAVSVRKPRKKTPWHLFVGIPAAAILLAAVVTGLALLLKRPTEPKPVVTEASAESGTERAGPATDPGSIHGPSAVVTWEGFDDPTLRARDRLLALGKSLTAFEEKNHRPPADLSETEAKDDATAVYLGPKVASLDRFRPLAHVSTPDAAGRISVLFSDQSVRPVMANELSAVLLTNVPVTEDQPGGWLTLPDAELLTHTAPQLRVNNARFSDLEVFVDGRSLGSATKGSSQTFAVPLGEHRVALDARGTRTEEMAVRFEGGILYEFAFHRHQDLPAIPVREYRDAIRDSEGSLYTAEKQDENVVTSLTSARETVHFPTTGGRGAVPKDLRSVDGRIEREQIAIEGLDGGPIRVSEVGRLEEGTLRYHNGPVAVYRNTALGTLVTSEQPNIAMASLARFPAPPTTADDTVPDVPMPGQRQRPRSPSAPRRPRSSTSPSLPGDAAPWLRDPTPSGRRGPSDAQRLRRSQPAPSRFVDARRSPMDNFGQRSEWDEGPLTLSFPEITQRPGPDCTALANRLRTAAAGVTALLLRQAERLVVSDDVSGQPARPRVERGVRPEPSLPYRTTLPGGDPRERARRASSRDTTARWLDTPGAPRDDRRPARPDLERALRQRPTGAPGRPATAEEAYDPSLETGLPLPEIAPADLFATLAVYGDPSAVMVLSSLIQELSPSSPGYGELLLALARCGRGQTLLQITSAAEGAPAESAVALAMIDVPAARKALREMLVDWSSDELAQAAEVWPQVGGPVSRRAFVETLAACRPDLLDDIPSLNALLKLEPHALQNVLAARLLEPPRQGPTEQAATAMEPSAPARPGRDGFAPPPARGRNGLASHQRDIGRPSSPLRGGDITQTDQVPPSWLVLGHFRHTESVAHFLAQLKGKDSLRKRHALMALAEARDSSLVAPVAPLLRDPDFHARLRAVEVLVAIGDPAAVKALHDGMTSDLLFAAVPKAASTLASRAGRTETAALLAKMLTLALKEYKPAASAPEASSGPEGPGAPRGERGGSSGRPPPAPAGRAVARGMPGMDPYAAASGQPESDSDVATPPVLLAALVELGVTSDAVQSAVEEARKHQDAATRAAAYQALSTLSASRPAAPGRGSVVRGVIKLALLPIRRGTSRIGAQPAASDAVGAQHAVPLQEALKDSDPLVRAAGISLLERTPAVAAPLLEAAITDTSPQVRAAALKTAGAIEGEDPRLWQVIAAGLSDPDPRVLAAAARAAAQRKDRSLGPVLVAALNRPATPEPVSSGLGQPGRAEAARRPGGRRAGVGRLRGSDAQLDDRDTGAGSRQRDALLALIEAAGVLREQRATHSLGFLLGHEDPLIRESAARALGLIGDESALHALLSARNDADPEVVSAVLVALSQLDSADAVAASLDALENEDLPEPVRRELLTRMVGRSAQPGVYTTWLEQQETLGPSSLETLVAMAAEGDPKLRAGFVRLAKQHLEASDGETRVYAAEMLTPYADDLTVRGILLDALQQDASYIAEPVAQVLRETQDPAMFKALWALYKPLTDTARRDRGETGEADNLASVSQEENSLLCTAIIEAIAQTGGDEAAQYLWRIALYEKRDDLVSVTIKALADTKSPLTVRYLSEVARRAEEFGLEAAECLARVGHLAPAEARLALLRLRRSPDTRIAAVAADALEALLEREK